MKEAGFKRGEFRVHTRVYRRNDHGLRWSEYGQAQIVTYAWKQVIERQQAILATGRLGIWQTVQAGLVTYAMVTTEHPGKIAVLNIDELEHVKAHAAKNAEDAA